MFLADRAPVAATPQTTTVGGLGTVSATNAHCDEATRALARSFRTDFGHGGGAALVAAFVRDRQRASAMSAGA
jgi:hypothetical protein